jgi:hypothetical protein
MNQQTPPAESPGVPENRLYVVLHGLVCLIDDAKNGFTAHLIDQGRVHEYKAGTFPVETPIHKNEDLKLIGAADPAKPGTASLDPDKNAILKKARPLKGAASARSKIELPRPNKIYHFVCGDVGGLLLDPDDELIKPLPSVISGTRVFQYSPKDFNAVQLVSASSPPPFWQCPPPTIVNTPQGDLAVAILEVYNEPPIDLDEVTPGAAAEHNRQEFADSLTFIQANNVELTDPALDPQDGDGLPPGLHKDQVCSLDIRDGIQAQLRGEAQKDTFALRFGKIKKNMTGGAGGTQVCGGANGILG